MLAVWHKPRGRWSCFERIKRITADGRICPWRPDANDGIPRLRSARAVSNLDTPRVAVEYLPAAVVEINLLQTKCLRGR